ncbi:phage protease [Dactylosporangium sucinum]|uniref:Uncharacterized protein n=1 Tax=Dactylosporangium sucinum TaxID=1424081 RepID=A0A917X0B4_9ACTN|nr:phage protease [Dactylosporangium sucinum]GGM53382.1 hypothetical protein GCM10007977_063730 [Dactylosporangium sucinum]
MTDVAVPPPPPLVRIPRVELIHTGTWPISTGVWTATREDLQAAVAALDCPAVHRPGIKIGHTDGRFTDPAADGEPLLGYIDNLTGDDDWHTLYGDYAGVPAWLGAVDDHGQSVISSAYPHRSIEGIHDFVCQIGHTHPFVLTAVALLGVTHPGVGTLQSLPDLMALYGVAATAGRTGTRITARVTDVAAHLPGQHDQRDHAGKHGPHFDVLDAADAVTADKVSLSGGKLEIVTGADGVRLGYDTGGDPNRSGALDDKATSELANLIDQHASRDPNPELGPKTWSVATYPPSEDGHTYATGYAQLSTPDGGATFELELLDNETRLKFTGAEAIDSKLADALFRASVARRFQGEYGRLDMYLTEDRFAFRMYDEDGNLTSVQFDGKSWAGISHAISTVMDGYDADDPNVGDDDPDITVQHVETNAGRVRVERTGDPGGFDRITVTPAEGENGTWAIYFSGADSNSGDESRDSIGHLGWLEPLAEQLGFYDPTDQAKVTARRRGVRAPFQIPVTPQAAAGPGERSTMPNPSPAKVAAGVTTEDVRRAYYDDAPWSYWITEFHLEPLQLIVCDDQTGKHYRVPVTVSGEDTFTFGDPVEVLVRYVDAGGEQTVAASRLVYASRAESRPGKPPRAAGPAADTATDPAGQPVEVQPTEPAGETVITEPQPAPPAEPAEAPPTDVPAAEPDAPTNQEDNMSLSAIRARLGLADDADEAAVLAALDAKLPTEPGGGATEPDTPAVQPEPVAAKPATPVLPDGVVTIDAATLAELRRGAQLGIQAAERQRIAERDATIAAAREDGRISPARVEHWTKAWEADPDGTRDTLAGLEPGLIVPTVLAGSTGNGEEQADLLGVSDGEAADWAAQLGIDAKELTRG